MSDLQDNPTTGPSYPAKPVLMETRKNALRRSLIGLLIFGLVFYFIFNNNLAYIAAILVTIIVHEVGHLMFMRRFGYAEPRVFILPVLAGLVPRRGEVTSQGRLVTIILAGPLPGLVIGSALFYSSVTRGDENLKMLGITFLAINLLNCVPLYFLDGGRLMETLFFREAFLVRFVLGLICIAVILLLLLVTQGFLLIFIPALIGLELYNESKHQKIRDYLRQEGVNYRVPYSGLPDKDYWLIRDALILSFPKKYVLAEAGKYEYSIVEGALVAQVKSVLQPGFSAELPAAGKAAVLLLYLLMVALPLALIIRHAGLGQ